MSGYSRPVAKGREIGSRSQVSKAAKGQIQNVKAARVYVFGDSDVTQDDVREAAEMEMPEIRSRRNQNGGAMATGPAEVEELFFEKEIGDGETLQSLSLKYACPMSELKRVNNLMKDQDFFALRVLKIPMKRHGLLSERVQHQLNMSPGTRLQQHQHSRINSYSRGDSITSDSDPSYSSDVDFSDPETQRRIMRSVSIRENFSRQGQGREASRFLKKMDRDLEKLRLNTVTDRGNLDEVVTQLTRTSFHPLERSSTSSKGSWVDCGVPWWVMVLMAMTVAVLVPTTYIIYVKFFMDRDHHPS